MDMQLICFMLIWSESSHFRIQDLWKHWSPPVTPVTSYDIAHTWKVVSDGQIPCGLKQDVESEVSIQTLTGNDHRNISPWMMRCLHPTTSEVKTATRCAELPSVFFSSVTIVTQLKRFVGPSPSNTYPRWWPQRVRRVRSPPFHLPTQFSSFTVTYQRRHGKGSLLSTPVQRTERE